VRQITERAYLLYGERHQLMKAAEECSELSAAINRYLIGDGTDSEVEQEAADVIICMEYIKMHFGADNIQGQVEAKLDRLDRKMKGAGA
jgi:NTP pyrophosphatase (non-canonical NTP hydrolase)